MRRSEREVTDFTEIIDILNRTDTIRLGLHAEPYPYVVPLSFGFTAVEGKITFYFHGAKAGFKHDLIQKNPLVCVETDIFHSFSKTTGGVTTEYESFIGFGKVERLVGETAGQGLDCLLRHCGFADYAYNSAALTATWVYKIDLSSFTVKRRFLEKALPQSKDFVT